MDTDGDGIISYREFDTFLYGYDMLPWNIKEAFFAMDMNDDMEITKGDLEHAEMNKRHRAEVFSILKKEQKKQKKGNRRLDDFSEQQLNDGLH